MFYWSLNIFWTSLTVYLTLFVKPETIIMIPKIDWTQNIKLIFKIENLVLAKTIPSLVSSCLLSIRFPKRLESTDNTLTTGFIGELILNSKKCKCMKKKKLLLKYSQTCIQRLPLGPEKSGRLKEGPDKTEI